MSRPYGTEARDQILRTAEELFAARGLEAVSMDDIARCANVSRASVFNHFGSKHLLLDAITARSLRTYRDLLSRALDDETTPTPALLAGLFAAMAMGLEANRGLYREVYAEIRKVSLGMDRDGLSPGLKREALEVLTAIFERGRRRGDIAAASSAEVLATAFDSLLSGAVTAWLRKPADAPIGPLLADLCDIFLKGAAAR